MAPGSPLYLPHVPQTKTRACGGLWARPDAGPGSFPREGWRMLSAGSGVGFLSVFWSVGQRWESFTAEVFKWLFRIRRWL